MNNNLKIIVRELNRSGKIKCALDSPRAGMMGCGPVTYLSLAGWVYSSVGEAVEVVLSHMPGISMPLNKERPDVKKAISEAPMTTGFKYPIEYSSNFKVGIKSLGEVTWLFQVNIEVAKVLKGANGHLFLDKDQNRSVDQFTGNLLIPNEELNGWDKYFAKLNEWSIKSKKPYSFMIAPAKEYIYTDSYPLKKGKITPYEQFLGRYLNVAQMTDLTENLIRDREFAYYKTDSHWNDYGASLAASTFCRKAGFKNVSPDIRYVVCPIDGDLGSKLHPVQLESSLVIKDRCELIKHRVYNNNIKVRGGVVIYNNENAPNKIKLMIFGDSFSVSLSDFLSHSFSKVIRVFSGADVDWQAVEFENPDYILVEMTSRFLIRSPSLRFSIEDEVLRKYKLMNKLELKEHADEVKKNHSAEFEYYVEISRKALDKAASGLKCV